MTDLSKVIKELEALGIHDVKEVVYNPSYEQLFEEETKPGLDGFEKGTVTTTGAVAVDTGIFTGRSPKDKYIVLDDTTKDTVWWTSDAAKNDNKPMTQETWASLKGIVTKQLSGKRLFVVDGFCGASEQDRIAVRIVTEVAWQAHFVKNMFIRPTEAELKDFKPGFVVMNGSKCTNPNWKEQGLLTVAKAGKKNIFSGRILEIEGLPDLKVEQAFELTDASAERSAAGCTVKLNKEPIIEYMQSNIVLMKNMIADGYKDPRTLERRIKAMEKWLADPQLLEADKDAEYAAVIEINMDDIKEPIIACPNDPDDVCFMSEKSGTVIDEVFIGSCMTNIGHFRAASKLLEGKSDIPVRLWMAPPTKMDAKELSDEGHYGVLGCAGARMEMPGCSLCMGNQAQVREGATVMSTSTRNFPNRLGKNTFVYLGSAALAAICSKLGKIPTVEEYQANIGIINEQGDQIYRYMNFNEIDEYNEKAEAVNV